MSELRAGDYMYKPLPEIPIMSQQRRRLQRRNQGTSANKVLPATESSRVTTSSSTIVQYPLNSVRLYRFLLAHLSPNSPLDVCILAAALTIFWGQCCLAELLPLTHDLYEDSSKLPVVSNLSVRRVRGVSTCILHLPSTEKAPVLGEDVALISIPNAKFDAPGALRHHIKLNRLAKTDPLFAYRHGSKGKLSHLTSLTSAAYFSRCKTILASNGIPDPTRLALPPTTSSRTEIPPVSVDMLDVLLFRSSLDLDSPFDACVLATALTAFWGQCRLWELLPCSHNGGGINNTDPLELPVVSDLTLRPTDDVRTTTLHLPSTKHYPIRREEVSLIFVLTAKTDAPRALKHHIKLNRLTSTDCLFAYRHGGQGPLLPLTATDFLSRCNSIFSTHGLPCITSRSLRIGGTTELLVSGMNTDKVIKMGRWRPHEFLFYWRWLEHSIPKDVRDELRISYTPVL